MMPATEVPIEIRRGNNDPAVIWEFTDEGDSATNLAGSVFDLIVAWPAASSSQRPGMIMHSSDKAVDDTTSALEVDAAAGRVTWPYTLAESQQIPCVPEALGARYVLRRTIQGKTRDWAGGPVTVRSYLP